MEKVIESLQTGTNALLESPTGTGKTISLLCAALSWQEEYASALKVAKALDELLLKASGTPDQAEVEREVKNELDCRLELIGQLRLQQSPLASSSSSSSSAAAGADSGFSIRGIGTYVYTDDPAIAGGEAALAAGAAAAEEAARRSATQPRIAVHPLIEASRQRQRPPKIIYASRTHSQLSQVIRELKRSSYRPRVSVLASREQLCVDARVSQLRGATQSYACRSRCRDRKCGARNTLEDWVAQKRSVHDLHRAVTGAGGTLRMPQGTVLEGMVLPDGADAELQALEAAAAAAEGAATKAASGFDASGSLDAQETGIEAGKATSGAGNDGGGGLLDVEELAAMGRSKGVCPYFASRDALGQLESDIVLVPYNYLVDPEVRGSLSVEWEDAVVIVDEAHNLESVAAEAASFDFGPLDFSSAQREVQTYLEGLLAGHGGLEAAVTAMEHGGTSLAALSGVAQQQGGKVSLDMALKLKDVIRSLEAEVAGTPLPPAPSPGKVEPGTALVRLLDEYGINVSTWDQTRALIDGVTEWLMARDSVGGRSRTSGAGEAGGSGLALDKLKRMIAAALRVSAGPKRDGYIAVDDPESVARRAASAATAQFFRMVVHRDQRAERRRAESGRDIGDEEPPKVLSYWCFSPGVAFGELRALGVRAVILTSGTLSPMDSYAAELQTPFPVRLENPHVVDASQLFVGVVSKGPMKRTLNSSYQNRSRPEYKQELGSAIRNVAKLVPDGLLVFFPSYAVMQDCITFWKTANGGATWTSICGLKHTVVEDRNPALLSAQMKEYDEAIRAGKGAAFFAVCRGKVSEGLDFSDAHGRAVIVTGLPFPPRNDAKVLLKQRFLDDALRKTRRAGFSAAESASSSAQLLPRSGGALSGPALSTASLAANAAGLSAEGLSGQAWYRQQASRAVNQAIGRVIRHRNDWGAILLFDERFVSAQTQLSAWLRPYARVMDSWASVTTSLRSFFAAAGSRRVSRASDKAGAPSDACGSLMVGASSSSQLLRDKWRIAETPSAGLVTGDGCSAPRAQERRLHHHDDDGGDDDDDEAALERMLPERRLGQEARLETVLTSGKSQIAGPEPTPPHAISRQAAVASAGRMAPQRATGGKTTLAAVFAASGITSAAASSSARRVVGGRMEIGGRRGDALGVSVGATEPVAAGAGRGIGGGKQLLEQLRRLGEQEETRVLAGRLHVEQRKDYLRRKLARAAMDSRTRDADLVFDADSVAAHKGAVTSLPSGKARGLVRAAAGAAMLDNSAAQQLNETEMLADASLVSPARITTRESKPAWPVTKHPAVEAASAPDTLPPSSADKQQSLREAMQQVLAAAKTVISAGRDGAVDPARAASGQTRSRIRAIGALVRQWTERSAATAGDDEAQRQVSADVARRWAEILGVLPAAEEKSGSWSRVQAPMRSRVTALTTLARLQAGSKSQGFKEATKAIVRQLKERALRSPSVAAAVYSQESAPGGTMPPGVVVKRPRGLGASAPPPEASTPITASAKRPSPPG